jgi:hypothetical protein
MTSAIRITSRITTRIRPMFRDDEPVAGGMVCWLGLLVRDVALVLGEDDAVFHGVTLSSDSSCCIVIGWCCGEGEAAKEACPSSCTGYTARTFPEFDNP